MKNKATLLNIKIDDLVLDSDNPRFAELYNGSKSEEDLITYLLYTEAAEDVAKAINTANEFYQDRPLWIIKKDGKYLVKDGNRRCAAVKALQMPGKYGLTLPKTTLTELPTLLYSNQADIDIRIVEEHAGSLFRRWGRIARALEAYKLFKINGLTNALLDMDSQPGDLIKLSSFYYEAVKIGGDKFRDLLKPGKSKKSGKTIVFERLFKFSSKCGYEFKRKPAYIIDITDRAKFSAYIKAVVEYLDETDDIVTNDTIDKESKSFFNKLKDYGFDIDAYAKPVPMPASVSTPENGTPAPGSTSTGTPTGSSSPPPGTGNSPVHDATGSTLTPATGSGGTGNGSTKRYPILKRKGLPPGIRTRITEYFKLDAEEFTNAKVAMSRVTFECVLKYVIENTKFNGKTTIHKTSPFNAVYSSKIANATLMKVKFTELIMNTGDQNAFKSLNLDDLNQIIHNYKVGALVKDAKQIAHNMIHLIEFLLQDEADLLSSLDLTKL